MTTLTEYLQLYVPRVSVPSVAQRFHNDQMAVVDYVYAVYGADTALAIFQGGIPSTGPVFSEVLMFPVRADMDPREDETARWASFACEHTFFDESSGVYKSGTRFPDPDDIFLLLDAGVPISYASSAAAAWGEYPTGAVVAAWQDGVPLEYLSAALGPWT